MKTALVLAATAALLFASHAQQVRVTGSDSMVLVAMAWAEKCGLPVEVMGGGSGVGFAALINGSAQVAMSTREPAAEEVQKLTEVFGGPPVQTAVAYEALTIFVNKANPVEKITFDELRGIYLEGGKIDDWKQLGSSNTGAIVRLNRMSNSGVHVHFRTTIGDRRSEFRAGSKDFLGSRDVVTHCAKTPAAICYAALAYAQDGVKALPVAKDKDGKPVLLSPANVRDGSYPLGRKLYFVTTPKADAATKKFIQFVTEPAGQKIAVESGLIPLAD